MTRCTENTMRNDMYISSSVPVLYPGFLHEDAGVVRYFPFPASIPFPASKWHNVPAAKRLSLTFKQDPGILRGIV